MGEMIMRKSVISLAAPIAFFIGIGALAYSYGYLTGRYWIFPADHLSRFDVALRAMWVELFSESDYVNVSRHDIAGAVMHEPALVQDGLNFLVLYKESGFEAQLMTLQGSVVHRWRIRYEEAFPEAPQLQWRDRSIEPSWHGAILFPNGDILFNFQDAAFPYALGSARIDRNSNIVWTLPRNTHHDVFLDEDDNIWIPALHYRPDGIAGLDDLRPWYYEDTVLKISPDGVILDEVSVLQSLKGNSALLSVNYGDQLVVRSDGDPLHLNNVDVLSTELSASFPMFKAGDILVSMRNINTIGVIDRETRMMKWSMTGPFVRQHDPDYLSNGHILVYDNRGGEARCGLSRILEIDPSSRDVVWSYDGCDTMTFYSRVRGEVQALDNGNRLIVEATQGHVLEVTGEREPRIVWEFSNRLGPPFAPGKVGIVTQAIRVSADRLSFLD